MPFFLSLLQSNVAKVKKKKNKTFKCLAQASSMCVVVVFAQCTHIVEVKCYMFRFFRRRARETTDGSLVVYPP